MAGGFDSKPRLLSCQGKGMHGVRQCCAVVGVLFAVGKGGKAKKKSENGAQVHDLYMALRKWGTHSKVNQSINQSRSSRSKESKHSSSSQTVID